MGVEDDAVNKIRIANGKFCLCNGTSECDFHKRGGYTTAEDDVEYEVVWNGGPLLPPRDQRPDSTWTAPNRKYNMKQKTPPEQVGVKEQNGKT